MHPRAKILVVDDEAAIRYFLTETLAEAGYDVLAVESGEAALDVSARQEFDLVLLDLKMKGVGGMGVLKVLSHQAPETAVIVLTAHASLETAVEALRQGAHDYLFKPCEPKKLRESVRTGLVKRQRQLRHREVLAQLEQHVSENLDTILVTAFEKALTTSRDETPEENLDLLSRGPLAIDLAQHVATYEGQPLELSPTEFDLLAHLLAASPRVISPDELAEEVLNYAADAWGIADLMRTHVYRLRQKIRAVAPEAEVIETVRGVGYKIDLL